MVRYDPDHRGMARLLMQRDMANPTEDAAQQALQYARSISPEVTGNYKASFQIEHVIEDGRQTIIISNTSPYASFVEWGGRGAEGQHILARTADFIEANAVDWRRSSRLPRKTTRTTASVSAPRSREFSVSQSGKRYYSKRGPGGRFVKR